MGDELLLTGFVQRLEFLKFSAIFQTWKNGDKAWKERKKVLSLFSRRRIEMIFFPFGKMFAAHHEKTFLRLSSSILITYLITLSLE